MKTLLQKYFLFATTQQEPKTEMLCTEYSINSQFMQDKVNDHWDCDGSQLVPIKGETSFSRQQNVAILVVEKLRPAMGSPEKR